MRNRLLWMQEQYQLGSDDAVLQKTAFSFDVSVWEFFWPLLTGARLVLARPGGERDSEYLVETIIAQQVTTVHFVPSLLQVLLDEGGLERCRSLRQVFCSGEALSLELEQRFLASSGAALHNLYGPTEAAIDVTAWECERGSQRGTVPIGRPIANLQMYILDAGLRAVPVGVAGELYIGGVGLGRGYWRRPELTAERFIPHPYGKEGARIYRTGDVARYGADGAIEYLGRVDHQVKVRGFRIELGEIETALRSHTNVREAVVVARAEASGARLLAYVVPNGEVSSTELRRYVGERLPEYMVPAVIVELEELPLLSNGKLNRRALPETDGAGSSVKRSYAPPRTPVERQLVQMWEELLGVKTVGIEDHFFELGGHSLMLTQLASRIRKEFQVNIPLRVLFDAPTVIAMSNAILAEQVEQVDKQTVDEMLQRLKQLSPEQMKALLEESQLN